MTRAVTSRRSACMWSVPASWAATLPPGAAAWTHGHAAGPEHGAYCPCHQACAGELRKAYQGLLTASFRDGSPDPRSRRAGAAHADVVIEAIFENVEAKHALFRKLDAIMRPDAVLATNTSSLRLEDLRTVLQNPARLVGIHFFNPVAKMPLVEVVSAEGGDPEMAKKAAAFVRQIDRLPLPVQSAPGFPGECRARAIHARSAEGRG